MMAVSPPRCARLFILHRDFGQNDGPRCAQFPLAQIHFKFNEHRQWSRRPQPRESGGDATPLKDTGREHWRCPTQMSLVVGCFFFFFFFGFLLLATRPVVSMANSAGQFPVWWSTRVKGLRLCYTGRSRRVHVLDGSGGCGMRPDEGREATLESEGSGGREDV